MADEYGNKTLEDLEEQAKRMQRQIYKLEKRIRELEINQDTPAEFR